MNNFKIKVTPEESKIVQEVLHYQFKKRSMDIHKKQLKEVITENLPNIDKCTEEILRLFIVVRRSELLNCPYCESSNIRQKTKSEDECKDCGKTWAV